MSEEVKEIKRKLPQDRLAKKKANSVRVRIAMDPEAADRYEAAKFDHDMKRDIFRSAPSNQSFSQDFEQAETELREARHEFENTSVEFVFRALSPQKYDELLRQHQPTDAVKLRWVAEGNSQQEADNLPWDPYTFNRSLVQACCVDPRLTDEQIVDIFDGENWSTAEAGALVHAAQEVNATRRVVDLAKG